jgi:hypothetical protein
MADPLNHSYFASQLRSSESGGLRRIPGASFAFYTLKFLLKLLLSMAGILIQDELL